MILRFGQADMGWEGLLTAYLDDTYWIWGADAFDRPLGALSIQGQRIQFESLTHRRILGIIPVTECAVVPALLTVARVVDVTLDPERTHRKKGLRFEVAELTGLNLTVDFDGGRIAATLSSWTPLILRDAGPPTARLIHSYYGRGYHASCRALAEQANARQGEA